jgi:ribonuclease P/MRP protein subunit RPP40
MVSGLNGKTYEEKLKEVGLTTLEERRVRGDMIECYKILTGKYNVSPDTWFTMANDGRQGMGTRNSNGFLNIARNEANLDIRKNFFSVRVWDKWNSLDSFIKEAPSKNAFKNRYDRKDIDQPAGIILN